MKKRYLPTPENLLSAIRQRCLDCCGNARLEVERCRITSCPLHPYRSPGAMKKKPEQAEISGQLDWFGDMTKQDGRV